VVPVRVADVEVDGEPPWPCVTVTVTVVVDPVRVLVLLVRVVVVRSRRVPGGLTVTVLEVFEPEQSRGMGAISQGPWGGAGSGPASEVVEASDDEAVSPGDESPEPVPPALPDSVHGAAGTTGQRALSRPPPGAVVDPAARTAAARLVAGAGPAAASPPEASTPTGTAAATASGAHRRTRARTPDHRSRGGTALSSRETWSPAPARRRAAGGHMLAFPRGGLPVAFPTVARWPDARARCGADACHTEA
jgi:hypothetical protein